MTEPLEHPFRTEEEPLPRFVCIVCFKGWSLSAGPCMACSAAPLVPLDDPDAVVELRRHIQKVQSRRLAREWAVILIGSGLIAGAFFAWLLAAGYYDISTRPHAMGRGGDFFPFFIPWFVLIALGGTLYPKMAKGSAMASTFKPLEATVPSLLKRLGLGRKPATPNVANPKDAST